MSPEPGWYRAANDPPDVLRWWDGGSWSEHTHELSDQSEPSSAQPDVAAGSADQTVMFPFQASSSEAALQEPLSVPEADIGTDLGAASPPQNETFVQSAQAPGFPPESAPAPDFGAGGPQHPPQPPVQPAAPTPTPLPGGAYPPGPAAGGLPGQFQPNRAAPIPPVGVSSPPTYGAPSGYGPTVVAPGQWPGQPAAPSPTPGAAPPPAHRPAKNKSKAGLIVGLIAGLFLLAGVVAVGVFALRSDDQSALNPERVDVVDATTTTGADSPGVTTPEFSGGASSTTTADVTPPTTVVVIPDDLSYADAIDVSLADVQEYWSIRQPEVFGTTHDPVANIVAYKPSDPSSYPSCGGPLPEEVVTGNAFYCPLNDTIAWDDEILLPGLYEQFGDLAVSMVLVHEYGHAIQNRVDTTDQPTIVIELQADCFTGAWAGAADRGESPTGLQLADGDLDEALAGYLTVRDPPGTDPADPSAHGNGFDRLSAFLRGYRQDVESCADIDDNPPTSSKLPPTVGDLQTGGNLPLDQLLPLLEPDLDTVFAALVAQEGLAYRPPVRTQFDSRNGGVGGCPGAAPDAMNDLEAVACVDQNEIVWDLALADELFEIQGDIGATYPLIHAWAQLIVAENNLADGERAVELADCWAGAFLSVLFPVPGETKVVESQIRLSPGDLDEAIGTLLVYQPPLLNGSGRYSGQAFARLAYLQDGVIEGPSACLS